MSYSEAFVINDIPDTYSPMKKKILKTEQDVASVNFMRSEDKKFPYAKIARLACITGALYLAGYVVPLPLVGAEQFSMPTSPENAVPKDVDNILRYIQLILLGLCVTIAAIMAMIAGFIRIVGLREESNKRFMDAIVGMIMVLAAPTILLIIATIVRGILSIMPGSMF